MPRKIIIIIVIRVLTPHTPCLSCRALLVYCLRHYKGDDKIKSFIWDLITPTKEGQDQALLNHSGERFPLHICHRVQLSQRMTLHSTT